MVWGGIFSLRSKIPRPLRGAMQIKQKNGRSSKLDVHFRFICGKRGIRTPGTVTRTPHFECGPFDHSGIFPKALQR